MTLDAVGCEAVDVDPPLSELLSDEISHLHTALVSRTITAQATGLLAGKFDLPLPLAWELLRRLSMESNRKLRDVARILLAAQDGTLDDQDQETATVIADGLAQALSTATSQQDAATIERDLQASA